MTSAKKNYLKLCKPKRKFIAGVGETGTNSPFKPIYFYSSFKTDKNYLVLSSK